MINTSRKSHGASSKGRPHVGFVRSVAENGARKVVASDPLKGAL